ncbi:hypothetical protein ACP4OV_024016 [Aristida adscensionis]
MAASSFNFALAVLFALASTVPSCRGRELVCEELPADACAFAVSSGGRRCVLERTPEGADRCQTSAVAARGHLAGWVENDACVRACGVDRAALGLPVASDAAADRRLARALCSAQCREACPNIVDLYATLAAGEGLTLPALCEALKNGGNRRMMAGIWELGADEPAAAPK